MKKLTAVLACLILLSCCFNETEAKSNDAGYAGCNDGVCHKLEYTTKNHQDDSLGNGISYLSVMAAKGSNLPYIKQITGAICLLFAWYLNDSNKD